MRSGTYVVQTLRSPVDSRLSNRPLLVYCCSSVYLNFNSLLLKFLFYDIAFFLLLVTFDQSVFLWTGLICFLMDIYSNSKSAFLLGYRDERIKSV